MPTEETDFKANLVLKEDLSLVRGQVDVHCGRRHCNAQHEDGVAVPGSLIGILSSIVLAQHLKSKQQMMHIRFTKKKKTGCSVCVPEGPYLHDVFVVDGSVVDKGKGFVRG